MEEFRKHPTLSEREQQLITLATVGLTDGAIAMRLGISEPTVKSYWGRVRSKLGPYNRTELVAFALKEEGALAVAELRREIDRLKEMLEAQGVATTDLHQELLENAPDAVFAVDEQGEIIWMNLEAVRMFGYSYGEVVGKHVSVLIPEELEQIHRQHMENYFAIPERKLMGEHLVTSGVRKSGDKFSIAATLAMIETSRGKVVGCFVREVAESRALSTFIDRHGIPESKIP